MIESTLPITGIRTVDARFPLPRGAGSTQSYGVTLLDTDRGLTGVGLVSTPSVGDKQIRDLIEAIGARVVGREIEAVMAGFGSELQSVANDPQYRGLGLHKGLINAALASITNACFDLWAKSRTVPLWRLLLDLPPKQLVATLDLSYLEDVLTAEEAAAMIAEGAADRATRSGLLDVGYPSYETSFGWMASSDDVLKKKAKQVVAGGERAVKLNVGSGDVSRDVRRATKLRSLLGNRMLILLDANQAWNIPQAISVCSDLAEMDPYWIAQPTHPDDVLGHALISREIAPTRLAAGSHVANRIVFKQLLETNAVDFVQPDVVRLGGVSEFVTVSLLAKKYDKPVVPHIGDMGQIHQHLVLFNHVALGHEPLFLEHSPHLHRHFLHPAIVEDGIYWTPEEPGSGSDLLLD